MSLHKIVNIIKRNSLVNGITDMNEEGNEGIKGCLSIK